MSAQAPTLTGPGPEEHTESSNPRRPVYQTETTGTFWGDVREAAKVHLLHHLPLTVLSVLDAISDYHLITRQRQRISFDDVSRIGEIPCARTSLLNGIASGVGIGFIRGFNVRE